MNCGPGNGKLGIIDNAVTGRREAKRGPLPR